MSSYQLIQAGDSDSFPQPHGFTRAALVDGTGVVIVGEHAGAAYAALQQPERFDFVAIELRHECLGVHVGESSAGSTSNTVGFARFRLGDAPPSRLVEVVKKPSTSAAALAAACNAFSSAELVTVVCNDFPGRIVNRLVRPFYNAVLRRLDEGLASAEDLDKTLCLGLGYPTGPIALLEQTGLEHHYEVTAALYTALGQEAYVPARRALIAKQRALGGAAGGEGM
jgi:3-hydroxybutyryl-CoA dehydrogenase